MGTENLKVQTQLHHQEQGAAIEGRGLPKDLSHINANENIQEEQQETDNIGHGGFKEENSGSTIFGNMEELGKKLLAVGVDTLS